MINTIALSFREAEDNIIGFLIFQTRETMFSSREKALLSLTEYLYKKYCNEFVGCNLPCNKCGHIEKSEFDPYDWQEFLVDLLSKSNDDFARDYDDVEVNPDLWEPLLFNFDVDKEQILYISESAEVILTIALRKLHPELFTNNKFRVNTDYREFIQDENI